MAKIKLNTGATTVNIPDDESGSVTFSNDQVSSLMKDQRKNWEDSYKNLQENYNKSNRERDKKIKEQEVKLGELEKRIQNSNSQAFAILSIFTTVFTFISINISIFQKVTLAAEAVFFMAIIAFFCLIIVSVPLLLLQSLNGIAIQNKKAIWAIFLFGIGALILMCLIVKFINWEIILNIVNNK